MMKDTVQLFRAGYQSVKRYKRNIPKGSFHSDQEGYEMKKDYLITEYGAAGDGKSLNTAAIQRAIDVCGPGETVRVPAGCFLTGAIELKSDMTLFLEEGAVLLGSGETKDFPIVTAQFEGAFKPCYSSLINIRGKEGHRNIRICGSGKIHGNGAVLGPKELAENKGARGRTIYAEYTEGLTVEGVTVREAPSWCFHLFDCRNVLIRGISLYNKFREDGEIIGIANNDGIDPECCQNVRILDCFIESEDDCIAIKSGRDAAGRQYGKASENILVSGCRFSCGFGVACGSEMAGGVRNIRVENCSFTDSFSIASVKNCRGRGSVIEDVVYENCTLINRDESIRDSRWFRGAIYVDQYYGIADEEVDLVTKHEVTEATPAIRNITFRNLSVDTVGGNAIYICGLPECHVKNITLDNIRAAGRKGMFVQNADEVTIRDLELSVRN